MYLTSRAQNKGNIVMSNFLFLKEKWPLLAQMGDLAEKNLHTDPNTGHFGGVGAGEGLGLVRLYVEMKSRLNSRKDED